MKALQRQNKQATSLPTYSELLQRLAEETDGFSGASLAAVARAAASHALERALEKFTHQHREGNSLLNDCVVTIDDFEDAKKDFENLGEVSDFSEPEAEGGRRSSRRRSYRHGRKQLNYLQ